MCIFEEFKCKKRCIHFHQFEIFAIKADEKQRKCDIFHDNFKIFLVIVYAVSLRYTANSAPYVAISWS